MRIKKVIANSYGEALSRVKSELGENAMVLSTRSIKFNKNQDASQCSSLVEITAAVDNDSHRETVAVAEKISSEKEWMPVNKGGEIRELRTMIASLLTRTDKAKSLGLNETLLPVYEKLIGRGVDDRVAARIFETIHERKQWKEGDPFIGENDLAAVMKGAVKCEGPIRLESEAGGPVRASAEKKGGDGVSGHVSHGRLGAIGVLRRTDAGSGIPGGRP
jgi:flagellar biosynthesis protein FlhF